MIYELCTLKHAFSANNLLGLVYKIIQEKQEPIPGFYSNDLRDLVAKMLIKDHKLRPDTHNLLKYDFVKSVAKKFIEIKGELTGNNNFMPVIKKTEVHLEKELHELGRDDLSGKTPKEKLEIKKRMEAEKKLEAVKQAIKENNSQVSSAKNRKQREMQSSMDSFMYGTASKHSGMGNSVVGSNKNGSMVQSRDFEGDATIESRFENTKGANQSKMQISGAYNDYPTQTINTMNFESSLYVKQPKILPPGFQLQETRLL